MNIIILVKGNYSQNTLRNIIEIAIETGMRRGEILNIKKEHIKNQTLLIPITKNGHQRIIPLTKRAKYILDKSKLPFLCLQMQLDLLGKD